MSTHRDEPVPVPSFHQIVELADLLRHSALGDQQREHVARLIEQIGWSLGVTFHGAGECARWEPVAQTYAQCVGTKTNSTHHRDSG